MKACHRECTAYWRRERKYCQVRNKLEEYIEEAEENVESKNKTRIKI
jgi:hypothetical protein